MKKELWKIEFIRFTKNASASSDIVQDTMFVAANRIHDAINSVMSMDDFDEIVSIERHDKPKSVYVV